MTKFIFLRGYVGTLNLMDGTLYATASNYNPENLSDEVRNRLINERIQRDEEMRNNRIISHEQYILNRDMMIEQEIVRRRITETENQIRLFNTITVSTINLTFWDKIKMFATKLKLFLRL